MIIIFSSLVSAVVGGLVTVVLSYWLSKKRRRLYVKPLIYRGFHELAVSSTLSQDDMRSMWEEAKGRSEHPESAELWTSICVIRSLGNEVIDDCSIRFRLDGNGMIISVCFYVGQLIVCDRLETIDSESRQKRDYKWKYLNPGDTLEVYCMFAETNNPREFTIEADAQGMELMIDPPTIIDGLASDMPQVKVDEGQTRDY